MTENNIRYYHVGGLTLRVDAPDYEDSAALAPFRGQPAPADLVCRLIFSPADELLARRAEAAKVELHEKTGEVLYEVFPESEASILVRFNDAYPECIGPNLILRLTDLPGRVVRQFGGVFLHSSFVDLGGEALLFTAEKQVGKSTQARLWKQFRGAETVNGDRSLLRRLDGRWCACGSPYCGTSKISKDRILPVRAIVLLSQAPLNRARPARQAEAFAALLRGCSFDPSDRESMEKFTLLAQQIAAEVPFYQLACTPDERAVAELEKLL